MHLEMKCDIIIVKITSHMACFLHILRCLTHYCGIEILNLLKRKYVSGTEGTFFSRFPRNFVANGRRLMNKGLY